MRKIGVLAAATTLSFAMLTGCGAPKVETLVDGMYDTETTSGKCAVVLDVDFSAEYDGEEVAAKINADLNVDVQDADDVENMSAAITGKVSYDIMDGLLEGEYKKLEAYVVTEDDEQTVYFKDPEDDNYYYMTNPIEEQTGAELSEKDIKKIQDAGKELWYKAEVAKKTEEVGGEKCYVLTMTPSGEDYIQLMDSVAKVMDMDDDWNDMCDEFEEEYDVSMADVLDNANIQFTAYVSQKNKYMVGVEVDMSGIDVEGMLDVLGDALDEMDVDPDDIEVNIKALSFSIIMSDINNTEVEIPKKVTKDAEEYNPFGYSMPVDDPLDDPIDDPIDDPVDDPVDEPTAEYYNEKTGEFVLCDYDGREIYTFLVPEGFNMSYASDDGTYYSLLDDDYEDYYTITNYAPYYLEEYILEDEMPDEDFYPNFECNYSMETVDGVDLVEVEATYDDDFYDEGVAKYYYLFIGYEDQYGDYRYIAISMTEDMYDADWDQTSAEIIEMLQLDY